MLGKEVFRFAGRGPTRSELRLLVKANLKAATKMVGLQYRKLVNPTVNTQNSVIELRPGWKLYEGSGYHPPSSQNAS